jgi:hypothetical protein
LVVVLLLGDELDELMPPLEPVELGDELLEPEELGEVELELPMLEPLEPGVLELDLPAPIEVPPELPELALPDSPAPLLQAVSEKAAAAIRASAVPRERLVAFIWELLGC